MSVCECASARVRGGVGWEWVGVDVVGEEKIK